MHNVLSGRIRGASAPLLLAAHRHCGCPGEPPLLGAALLDTVRPVAGGRWFARVAVDPTSRGQGVGKALALALDRALPTDRPPLSVEIDSSDARSRVIGLSWGLAPYQRSLRLEYDVTSAPAIVPEAGSWPGGVTVTSLPPDADEASWRQAFAVYAAVSLDLPDRAGAPEPDYTMFRAQLPLLAGVHIAWREGAPVGISVAAPTDDDHWYIFLTGSLRAERRTGVARAVKAAVHETVRRHGTRIVTTSTLETNVAMLRLNASLGYRIVGGISRFQG